MPLYPLLFSQIFNQRFSTPKIGSKQKALLRRFDISEILSEGYLQA